jgi:hypothetical protein
MDMRHLRALAGLSTDGFVSEAKKVVVTTEIDPALYTKKASKIVKTLLKTLDVAAAIKAVKAAMKSCDEECTEELQKAMDSLKDKMKNEEINRARNAAGLPLLEKKKDDEDGEEDEDEGKEEKGEKEEEDDLPSIVQKMAAKLLKSGIPDEDKLAALLLKVYAAGHTDGVKESTADEKAVVGKPAITDDNDGDGGGNE